MRCTTNETPANLEAREVRKLLEANPALQGLKDILEIHEDAANNVVQVDGMVCVGVPIGSPAFVHAFVADKTRKMVQDVKELQILTSSSSSY